MCVYIFIYKKDLQFPVSYTLQQDFGAAETVFEEATYEKGNNKLQLSVL